MDEEMLMSNFGGPGQSPVILLDGVCNLCHASARFVARHDKAGVFRFANLQSAIGQDLLAQYAGNSTPESVVLLENGKAYYRSDAALRIAKRLSGPWRYLYALRFIPVTLRDAVYNLVASTRYAVFGKKEECAIPTGNVKTRFLDYG